MNLAEIKFCLLDGNTHNHPPAFPSLTSEQIDKQKVGGCGRVDEMKGID